MTTTQKTKKLPSHDLFDVQEREGQSSFWNKVGAAFLNKDNSHTVLVYRPGRPDPRALQLRVIDRAKLPLRDGADPKKSPTHELFEVLEVENPDGGPSTWNRVGVAFTNKDGSLSVLIDEGDRAGPKARFQLRDYKPPMKKADAQASDAA